jgi:hypothetical protein
MPAVVSFPDSEPPPWPGTSTTGALLQILDPECNLIDLMYSAAWNLGKTLQGSKGISGEIGLWTAAISRDCWIAFGT